MGVPQQILELRRQILALKTRLGQVVLTGTTNPAAHASTHADAGSDPVNVTTLDGFPGGTSAFLRADGTFATPAGGGGNVSTTGSPATGNLTKFSGTTTISNGDLSGDVVTAGTLATTIANDAVTNAKLADEAQATVKGRAAAAGTGNPTDLTANEVSTILDTATDPFLRTSAATSGAPTGAQYLTLALDGGLSAERRLVAGSGISINDGGANGDATIAATGTAQGGTAGPTFTFTPPVDGDFAWINQGGASTATDGVGVYLLGPAGGGVHLRIRKKSAPATPYVITAGFVLAGPATSCGICFRQSSDGKLILMQYFVNNLIVAKYTNETTFSANYINENAANMAGTCLWYRLADNGTNRIHSVSADGVHFVQVHSVGRTDFLTADEVGFWVNAATNYAAGMTLFSWKQE